MQEASDQQRILLLLFILGQESSNSICPHETARSPFSDAKIPTHRLPFLVSGLGSWLLSAGRAVRAWRRCCPGGQEARSDQEEARRISLRREQFSWSWILRNNGSSVLLLADNYNLTTTDQTTEAPARAEHAAWGCGVLFQEPAEFLFCYVQLLENFVKKPASDLTIAMYWNSCCSSVGMLPSGVAAFAIWNPSFLAAFCRSLALAGMSG